MTTNPTTATTAAAARVRRRRPTTGALALATAVVGLLASTGALVGGAPAGASVLPSTGPQPAPPAAAADRAIIAGALDWGLKTTFRNYVVGNIAQGSITASDGATRNPDGTFRFRTDGPGSITAAGASVATGFDGAVLFTGHEGALHLTVSDPRIEITGDTGTLVLDLVNEPEGEAPEVADDIEFATLDLTGRTPVETATQLTWAGIPTAITAAGSTAMNDMYPAGTPLDPVSFTVRTTDAPGPPAHSSFVGLTPARILDSRDGTGRPAAAPWTGGATHDVVVAGAPSPVPSEALAVVLNVTAVLPTETTHLTVWPAGGDRPDASSLNVPAGAVRPNLVTVKVGAGGEVSIFNNSGTVDVVADVVGYYVVDDSVPGRFNGIAATRLLDSRIGNGTPAGPWTAGQTRTVPIGGAHVSIPQDATAVAISITATGASEATHLTVWPAGEEQPDASNLNLVPGPAAANLVAVKLGTAGEIAIRNNAGAVHVIGDVVGYYAATGDRFTPVRPSRLLDSRDGTGTPAGSFGAAESRAVGFQRGPVAATATSVAFNVAAVVPSTDTHLTVHPGDVERPDASVVNVAQGDVRANHVIVRIGGGAQAGLVDVFNNAGTADVIADVVGYFAP